MTAADVWWVVLVWHTFLLFRMIVEDICKSKAIDCLGLSFTPLDIGYKIYSLLYHGCTLANLVSVRREGEVVTRENKRRI